MTFTQAVELVICIREKISRDNTNDRITVPPMLDLGPDHGRSAKTALQGDWMDREQGEGHEFSLHRTQDGVHEATQVKNIWVPTGE